MKLLEITDKKSGPILKYINQLSDSLTSDIPKIIISDWKDSFFKNSDIYHYHYSNSTYKILLPLMFSNKNKNYVTIHDVLPRNIFLRKYFAPLIYVLLNFKSKKIIIHSKHAKELLLANFSYIPRGKLVVLPHGGNSTILHSKEISHLRKLKGISENTIVFLYVGYLKKSKGLVQTINAFSKISLSNIRLYLIGKILEKDILTILTKNNDQRIKYLGSLSEKELNEWFAISNALVNFRLDSVGETSGSVVYMLLTGNPILATKIGSNEEVIKSAGILCKNDAVSIQRAIQQFAIDKKLRLKLKKIAISHMRFYQWKNIKNKYVNLFTIK